MAEVKSFHPQSIGMISSSSEFSSVENQKMTIEAFCDHHGLNAISFLDINQMSAVELYDILKKQKNTNYIIEGLHMLPGYLSKLEDILLFVADIGERNSTLLSIIEKIDSTDEVPVFLNKLMRNWKESKKTKLSYNARASLLKAKKRNHKVGRKLKRDDHLIRELRSQGFSIREIAAKTAVSTTAVIRSLKIFKETPKTEEMVHD